MGHGPCLSFSDILGLTSSKHSWLAQEVISLHTTGRRQFIFVTQKGKLEKSGLRI